MGPVSTPCVPAAATGARGNVSKLRKVLIALSFALDVAFELLPVVRSFLFRSVLSPLSSLWSCSSPSLLTAVIRSFCSSLCMSVFTSL